MTFSTPAEIVSLLGDAVQVRHVYLTGLVKSYTIWTARLDASGYYLVTRPSDAVDFYDQDHSDEIIAGPFASVSSFAARETDTSNVVAVVLAREDGLWVIEYDYAAHAVTSGPTFLYQGSSPSLATGVSEALASYLVAGGLRARKGLLAPELEIARPSSSDLRDHDTHDKSGAPTVARYLGLHGQRAAVARRFTAEASSEALFESGLAIQRAGTILPYDEVAQESGGFISKNVETGYPSIGLGQAYKFLDPGSFDPPWGVILPISPTFDLEPAWSIHAWVTTPQSPYETVFLRGLTNDDDSYINIHLPWSNGYAYFDVYDTDHTLDRINKVLAPVSGMEHWVFIHNSSSGSMKIYRDGVLWHSGTNLKKILNPIRALVLGSSIYGNGWDGMVAELALFSYELGEDEVVTINDALPGYLSQELYPGLVGLWKLDDSELVVSLYDLSGNDNHLDLGALDYNVHGIDLTGTSVMLKTVAAATGVTIEAWISPRLDSAESYLLDANEIKFGYDNTGKLFFRLTQPQSLYTTSTGAVGSFSDGVGKIQVNATAHGLSNGAVVSITRANGNLGYHAVENATTNAFKVAGVYNAAAGGTGTWTIVPEMHYVQKSGRELDAGRDNYVAVSHVYGDATSTFMTVNGSQVEAEWVVGSGDLAMSPASLNRLIFRLGQRDRLLSWHLMSTAKALSQIRDYAKGKV